MTVKDLITKLLDEPMEAEIMLQTDYDKPVELYRNNVRSITSGIVFDIDSVECWASNRILINFTDWRGGSEADTIEPDSDTISRQAAMSAIAERMGEVQISSTSGRNFWEGLCIARSIVGGLSSAQPDPSGYSDKLCKAAYERGKAEPQQRWIPCSERLPEHSCQTLVTTKWDTEYSVEYGFYWGEDNKWGIITNNVIAWMPLPEPYKGAEHE